MFQLGQRLLSTPFKTVTSTGFGRHSSFTPALRQPSVHITTNSGQENAIATKTSQDESTRVKQQEAQLDDLYRHLLIKCTAHEIAVLDSYEKFVTMAAHHLGIEHVKTETPFRLIKRRTLLASRHVHKKYRVQYEIRNYYRHLLFKNLTGSTTDTFLEYVERNIPEGVLFEVEKHRLSELPFDLVDRKQTS